MLCITETWVSVDDKFTMCHATPNGFKIVSASRIGKRGGGIAVIMRDSINCKHLANFKYKTFEVLLLRVTSFTKTFSVATIYRPPGPLGNFLAELNEFLVTLMSASDDFILVGDFNIHMDLSSNDSSHDCCSEWKWPVAPW